MSKVKRTILKSRPIRKADLSVRERLNRLDGLGKTKIRKANLIINK